MKIIKRFLPVLIVGLSLTTNAQVEIVKSPGPRSFLLMDPSVRTEIVTDSRGHKSVTTAANLFSGDIGLVTGQSLPVVDVRQITASHVVLVGTIERILSQLNRMQYPSYLQLLYYNVKGSALFNQMWLEAEKANRYAARNFVVANSLQDSVAPFPEPTLGITLPDFSDVKSSGEPYHLPMFNSYLPKSYHIDLFNKGVGELDWRLEVKDDWIHLDRKSGSTKEHDRVVVSVDWEQAPTGEEIKSEIQLHSNGGNEKISLSLLNPSIPSKEDLKNLYIEDNGLVAIDATGYHRKKETGEIRFSIVEGVGMENKVVMLGDPLAKNSHYASLELTSNYVAPVRSGEFPVLEYDFYTFSEGPVDVYTYMVPQFPLNDESGSRYGVMLDNSPVYLPEASAPYYSTLWIQGILRNTRINKTTHLVDKPGRHTIKIYAAHPGVMLQKIVIDLGGMKRSYAGPRVTRHPGSLPLSD